MQKKNCFKVAFKGSVEATEEEKNCCDSESTGEQQ